MAQEGGSAASAAGGLPYWDSRSGEQSAGLAGPGRAAECHTSFQAEAAQTPSVPFQMPKIPHAHYFCH